MSGESWNLPGDEGIRRSLEEIGGEESMKSIVLRRRGETLALISQWWLKSLDDDLWWLKTTHHIRVALASRSTHHASDFGTKRIGYFAPIVVKHASNHQEKLNDLILLNPPHANLPSTLSIFSNFLLGEIFSQVYNILTRVNYMASDKTLTSCGPYKMKEDDAMAGHHVQEDSGEELGSIIAGLISRKVLI
ncbi:hypothetical protein R6Q59_018202 [Mikania micrantha]